MKFLSNPLLWFLLAIALFFIGSGAVGFIGPDEPRYADVARGMMSSGDYVTPRLFGIPWFEKPPLYYWLEALFFRLGVNEVDARLPAALSACAFIGVWFWFSRRLFGTRTAALACLVLASTLGWIGFAHAAVMDMLFTATLDTSLVLLAVWFWGKEDLYLYGFYAVLGLATLAKGPVAVGLAGLVALAYIVTYRDGKALLEIVFSPGLGLFLIVAVPWYLLCYLRNGYPFIHEFFIVQNWERFTTPALRHPQTLWFYFPILGAGLFPWTPLLLLPAVEIIDVLRAEPRAAFANRQKMFLLYWLVLPFAFFSLSQNKLPGYLLPILPPLTLWMVQIIEKQNTLLQNLGLWLLGLSALLLLSIPLIAPLLGDSLTTGLRHALVARNWSRIWSDVWKGPIPHPALFPLIVVVGLSLFMLWRRNLLEAAALVTVGVALSMMGIVQYLSPSINRVASVRFVAQRMQLLGISGEELAVYQLPRDQSLGLNFYMDRALPEWSLQSAPASIDFVLTQDENRLPDAQSRIFFPGQHLRLWALPPSQFEIRIVPSPGKSQLEPRPQPGP